MAGEMNFAEMNFTLRNGLQLPAVGLGTMGMRDYPVLYETMDQALQSGYRLFDTSRVFGNEKLLRNAFRMLLPKHGLSREDVFITAKYAPVTNNAKFVKRTFERTLENLDMEYIDLYLLQYPATPHTDPNTSKNAKMRADAWHAIVKLYNQSKIKAIGVSNFAIEHLVQLSDIATVGPMVHQLEWHPHYYQPDMLQYCATNGIRLQAHSSFGGLAEGDFGLIEEPVVQDVAKRYDASTAQVLLLWALQKGVAVIPKSKNPEHLKDNRRLNFRISEDDMALLDGLGSKNRKYYWNPASVV